jgi:hypothetical protein
MEQNVELAKKCLRLVRDIATRGVSARDDGQVVYAIQELSQVFAERAGADDRIFDAESAADLGDLSGLHEDPLRKSHYTRTNPFATDPRAWP